MSARAPRLVTAWGPPACRAAPGNVAGVSDPTTAQTEATVLTRIEGDVGHLTLNRPRAINALDIGMIRALAAALDDWEHDDAVRIVLLDGAGDRGLCAGGDVRGLREQIIAGDPDATGEFFRAEYTLNARIAEYPKPIVVVADGVTMGGGIGLAGHAAVRVVTERSKLAMPETRIGFTPDVGGTWLLGRAPGRIGEYLGLTGATMDAADALYAGFADRLVESGLLERFVSSLRSSLNDREGDPRSLERFVSSLRSSLNGPEDDPRSLSGAAAGGADETPHTSRLEAARPWIDDAFAADDVAGIIARLRARPEPDAQATADTLEELSPTALTVTLAAIRRARNLPDLRAALAQEYGLVLWFAHAQPDLVEGIRAQLVDKDRTPHWHPAALADVPADLAETALAYAPTVPLWA